MLTTGVSCALGAAVYLHMILPQNVSLWNFQGKKIINCFHTYPFLKLLVENFLFPIFRMLLPQNVSFWNLLLPAWSRVETSYYHHLAFIVVQKLFLCRSVNQDVVFSVTFNNISVISWRSVLLVEEIGITEENNRPAASH